YQAPTPALAGLRIILFPNRFPADALGVALGPAAGAAHRYGPWRAVSIHQTCCRVRCGRWPPRMPPARIAKRRRASLTARRECLWEDWARESAWRATQPLRP